jgi:AraC-like DNA-binding protein
MEGHYISTDQVAPRDAFAFWQDVICDTFINLDCSSGFRNRFSGGVYSRPLGKLQISAMASSEVGLSRTRSRIARARDEYCLIVVQGRGRTLAEQGERSFVLGPGDFALFDGSRPYHAQLEAGFHHFVLKIPRDLLGQRLGNLEVPAARTISGASGVGRVVSVFIRELAAGLQTIDEITAERMCASCVDLVVAALESEIQNISTSESTTRLHHLLRAKRFIAENIHRSGLSRLAIASGLGISPRYLSGLFADEGDSVGHFIWRFRVERCKIALVSPAHRDRTISEIAYSAGFNDPAHFSRLFREVVGMTPREFRIANSVRPGEVADRSGKPPPVIAPNRSVVTLLKPF